MALEDRLLRALICNLCCRTFYQMNNEKFYFIHQNLVEIVLLPPHYWVWPLCIRSQFLVWNFQNQSTFSIKRTDLKFQVSWFNEEFTYFENFIFRQTQGCQRSFWCLFSYLKICTIKFMNARVDFRSEIFTYTRKKMLLWHAPTRLLDSN